MNKYMNMHIIIYIYVHTYSDGISYHGIGSVSVHARGPHGTIFKATPRTPRTPMGSAGNWVAVSTGYVFVLIHHSGDST